MGPGLGQSLSLIKKRRRIRRRRWEREGQEKRERENRRPILRKLGAALLRLLREQHSDKMKGSARGNWYPREVQQPFRPDPNGVEDRTTTLRRLLIGASLTSRTHIHELAATSHWFVFELLFYVKIL